MDQRALVDLEELTHACRSDVTRQYIAEAVACYHARAIRSCIVATWTAVNVDILEKIRELETANDKRAQEILEAWRAAHARGDTSKAMELEGKLLTQAWKEFEFISVIEHEDLDRLRRDRHRCAHPSLETWDEFYQPPAEQARAHLRNAVSHLVQHPPTQGKAALEKFKDAVGSPHFPDSVSKAQAAISRGPLGKPRDALLRGALTWLLKHSFLDDGIRFGEFRRHMAAFEAIRRLHPARAEPVVKKELPSFAELLLNDHLERIAWLVLLRPEIWDMIRDTDQARGLSYVKHTPADRIAPIMGAALKSPYLGVAARERVTKASVADLSALAKTSNAHPEHVARLLELLAGAGDFATVDVIVKTVIQPLLPDLKDHDLKGLVEAALGNYQVSENFKFQAALEKLQEDGKLPSSDLAELRVHFGIPEPKDDA